MTGRDPKASVPDAGTDLGPAPGDQLFDAIHALLQSICARTLPVLSRDSSLVQLGLDSVARMQAVALMEKQFALEIDEIQAMRLTTVGDIVDLLRRRGQP